MNQFASPVQTGNSATGKKNKKLFRLPLFLVKYTRFEYFPVWLLYLPTVPFLVWLFIRNRSFTFFSNVNPCIEMGGFFGESKKDILDKVDQKYLPVTVFFQKGASVQEVESAMEAHHLGFPVILKPNIGERGYLVARINDRKALELHLSQLECDFILQEYVQLEIELGVLYYRLPSETKGKVSSVTLKKFLSVTGDGRATIAELMDRDLRSRMQLRRFKAEKPELLNLVLRQGETMVLENIGNHCKGTAFLNANYLINERLNEVFDELAKGISDFHYGRFDLRVSSTEHLYEGVNIKILELNGVSSDPGHIYDPQQSMFFSYLELMRHFAIVARIGRENRKRGYKYVTVSEFLGVIFRYFFPRKKRDEA